MKRILLSFVIIICILSGCTQPTGNPSGAGDPTAQTRIFTDSAGRNVEIPAVITKVAPSGPLAQVMLYMACPDMLAGISMDFPKAAEGFIPEKYLSLPKYGQFYGVNVSLNMEALIASAPDVIIDIGEAKDTIVQDMDGLQDQLGIPTVFIEASLDTMENAFLMLGDLTGDTERMDRLAAYCKDTVAQADAIRESLKDEDKVRVYLAMGEDGLSTNARNSFHADIINRVGAENVADIDASTLGGGSAVSFEQVLLWNPQVILVDSLSLYEKLNSDPIWRQISAIQNGRVYKIPSIPYSFVTNPPAANRILGIKWLGSILYPELYDINIESEVKTFFEDFYSINLSEEQYNEIMIYASGD